MQRARPPMARALPMTGLVRVAVCMLSLCLLCAPAAGPIPGFAIAAALAAESAIPRRALSFRSDLIRAARAFWGPGAPTATFAAQVHAESRWRPQAVSPAGAQGMAQFMPATARWIAGAYPHLSGEGPFNPGWALRAMVTYDRHLWERVSADDPCNRMAKVLAAYNGGLGWVRRDEALARKTGLADGLWFEGVETVNAGRSAAAKRENRAYPRSILLRLEPLYIRAGFGGGVCHD